MTFAVRQQTSTAPGGGPPGGGFTPVTHTYTSAPGTYTETVPGNPVTGVGPSQLVAAVGGPGGGGGNGGGNVGGGGGSGAICMRTIPLTPANWGASLTLLLTPGGAGGQAQGANAFPGQTSTASTITSSAFGLNMVAGPGGGGQTNGVGGAGGVASGGTTNLSGVPGGTSGGGAMPGGGIFSGKGGNPNPLIGAAGSPGDFGSGSFAYT
jgi:hypothetical protein